MVVPENTSTLHGGMTIWAWEEFMCKTAPVIRRYTLTELTEWVDMPMSEKFRCIDIDERRVVPDVEVRDAVINACGLRSISDFRLLTLEKRKSIIREIMLSIGIIAPLYKKRN